MALNVGWSTWMSTADGAGTVKSGAIERAAGQAFMQDSCRPYTRKGILLLSGS
jgi:hypothetical protein